MTPVVTSYGRRTRIVAVLMSVVVIAGFAVIGALLKRQEVGTVFKTSDQVAIIGIGVLIAAGCLLMGRPTVRADAERIQVRNIVLSHDLRWEVVESVDFPPGTSWPILQLHDDETVALLGIQSVDGARATAAVQGLRALLAARQRPA